MNEKYSTSRYDLDNVSAGSNVIFADSLVMSEGPQQYLISRGVSPYRSYIGTEPSRAVGDIHGVEDVSGLRLKLLGRQNPLEAPVSVRVRGTLFPSGLLASGWWEKNREVNEKNLKWSDELQEWLFAGFDLWGPSWDFCWNLDDSSGVAARKPYYIAQLGSGDEADSIPVLIPESKYKNLRECFLEGWGGVEVEVSGILGHRGQFCSERGEGCASLSCDDCNILAMFGGLLDYCLWLDGDDKNHKVMIYSRRVELYSGYLWRCLAPKHLIEAARGSDIRLEDVFFVWEHANFAKKSAVDYALASLEFKEKYISTAYGEMAVLQKSSFLVPGKVEWGVGDVYDLLFERPIKAI